MTKLYSELAYLYDALYQTFIDYNAEFALYQRCFGFDKTKSVLEIGCGSGHLAERFTSAGYDYTGVDISPQMLELARQRCPGVRFVQADMRTLNLSQSVDVILITARSLSYLLTNDDVLGTFRQLASHLAPAGTLHFDFIDATSFMTAMDPAATIEHRATYNGQTYLRKSTYTPDLLTGFTWNWHSEFYIEQTDHSVQPLADDEATLRAFLPNEIHLLLQLAGLTVTLEQRQPTYAFDTWVFSAQKAVQSQSSDC
ncbi:class I SAM-dependent methyltransferase [Fibrella forsythiae]|uniref:Class I SAM-dependent methyltransferase n=1 Tax=Fibrella forsythiae TaxID=2817061 RepID=A0ABS3JPT8_9BACT|nr:class I SAM-dependent methyltransferase [Fibrella forsythiae]MBO0951224.1 class I SAM-dependent methyltransferase [Fibrella forsythiae]